MHTYNYRLWKTIQWGSEKMKNETLGNLRVSSGSTKSLSNKQNKITKKTTTRSVNFIARSCSANTSSSPWSSGDKTRNFGGGSRVRDLSCDGWRTHSGHLPRAGSNTAWAACSSPTGVFSHIFFSFIATGESSEVATGMGECWEKKMLGQLFRLKVPFGVCNYFLF